jgi:hypothetical protein
MTVADVGSGLCGARVWTEMVVLKKEKSGVEEAREWTQQPGS